MKYSNKNKGFTLIETIAIIVILGVLMTFGIMSYTKYVKKSQKEYYAKQEELVTQAGRDFYNDNRGKLPTELGEENCVLLQNLIKNKYIDPVKDYNKNNCSQTKSKVCAQKISLTKYSYSTILDCGDNYVTPIKTKPEIKFKLDNNDFNYTSSTEKPFEGVENQIYEIKMHISDKKYDLKSYKYVIHKVGSNSPYLVIGPAAIPSDKKEYDVTIPLNVSGTYYIEGLAYNTNGGKTTRKSKKIKLKFSKLECDNSIVFSDTDTSWTNKNKTVVITKNDLVDYYYAEVRNGLTDEVVEKIGKEVNKYKNHDKTLSVSLKANDNEVKKYYLQIIPYDSNGKNYSCVKKSPVYQIDKIKPKCLASSNKSGWTNQDVTITVQCQDADSKCKNNTKTITLNTNYNGDYVASTDDNATNVGNCSPIKVQIDKTKPTATLTSTNNRASKQTVTLKCEDNLGVAGYYFGTSKPDNNTKYSDDKDVLSKLLNGTLKKEVSETYYLSCKDNAGNISDETKQVFYKTELVPQKGSVSPTTVLTPAGSSFTLPKVSSVTGYTFAKWNTKIDGTGTNYSGESSYKPTVSKTLYGIWSANKYNITLKQDDATITGTTKIYEKYETGYYLDSSLSKKITNSTNNITIPKRTGYTFAGYYTTSSGGTQYIDENGYLTTNASTTKFSADGNLFAHWTANKYKVVLVANNGNLLRNYDFTNTRSITSKVCGITGTHLNEWPIYDTCTPLGTNISIGTDTSSGKLKNYVKLNVDGENTTVFKQELPDVLVAGRKYVLSMRVKKGTATSNVKPKIGIVNSADVTTKYSVFLDGKQTESISIEPSSEDWETLSWIFEIKSNYTYNDNYINGYPQHSNCVDNDHQNDVTAVANEIYDCRKKKYFESGRPELYIVAKNDKISGRIDIDSIELYEAITLKEEKAYDSLLDDAEFSQKKKNGYDWVSWCKDKELKNEISGTNLKLNTGTADCHHLEDPTRADSICYIYAKWKEKTYTRNGKKMNNSDVMTTTCSNFNGWKEMEEKAKLSVDTYLSDATDNSGINAYGGFTKSYNESNSDHTSPFGDNHHYIVLNNSEHPNYNNSFMPGYGGYCQVNKNNAPITIGAGQEHAHVITLGMGTGLYLHYITKNADTNKWLTDAEVERKWYTNNEGNSSTRTYVYTIKNKTSNSIKYIPCVYFSPIAAENPSIRMRDHMSAYIYSSGVYSSSKVGQVTGDITLTCKN